MLSVSTQIAMGEDLAVFTTMLKSVAFADELIVFTMERNDAALQQLCKKMHARIIAVKTPQVVEAIRMQQIKAAKHDWVLIMDYDEVIPSKLAQEIQRVIEKKEVAGYYIKRKNYSLGRPLHHGGFGNDWVPRLFQKSHVTSWSTNIHALPIVSGELGRLKTAMEHHKDHSLEEMVEKTNRYTQVEARQFFVGKLKAVTSVTLLRKWWMETFRRGVLKGGLVDGSIGVIQSIYQGFSVVISYAKLYEKQQGDK